jgi:hypothetical protein
MTPTIRQIAVARLENHRADQPYSRARIPSGRVRNSYPEVLAPDRAALPEELTPASLARIARLRNLVLGCGEQHGARRTVTAPLPAPEFSESDRRIPMSYSPPRFTTRTPGKGPNKGKPVTREDKWINHLVTRTVTSGPVTYTATTKLARDGSLPPPSTITAANGDKLSPSRVYASLRLRWPDQATAILDYLLFR